MCIGGGGGPKYAAPLPKPPEVAQIIPVDAPGTAKAAESKPTSVPSVDPRTTSADTGLNIKTDYS